MRLKDYMIKNGISYQKLSDAVGSNPRVLHRWAHADIPSAILVAYNIVEATNGEVSLKDLAGEYLRRCELYDEKDYE